LSVAKSMKEAYELKVRAILGDEQEDDKTITILNRVLSWDAEGLKYEADSKHVTAILDYFGLDETSKGAEAPSVRETSATILEHSEPLNAKMKTEFRGLAARANYLSLDRMDIQHATKEACREMAAPTEKSLAKMKHLARYLLSYPSATIRFQDTIETNDQVIDVFSDSDWAGCLKTRRSTSGGVMMVAGGVVKTWSSTQATVAQSSGEAEYYAIVRAAMEAIGLKSIMEDLGWQASIRLWVDSSAAKSIASRVGLGRVRHLEVKFLWLQQTVKDKRVSIHKVRGDSNPADALTKPKNFKEVEKLLKMVGVDVKTRTDSNRAPASALPVNYLMKVIGKEHQKHFPISPKDYSAKRQKRFPIFQKSDDDTPGIEQARSDEEDDLGSEFIFVNAGDHTLKDERVTNWADALEEEAALPRGHEVRDFRGRGQAGMSRTLRPSSDQRDLGRGGVRGFGMLNTKCYV
jgi:hypothetical protein